MSGIGEGVSGGIGKGGRELNARVAHSATANDRSTDDLIEGLSSGSRSTFRYRLVDTLLADLWSALLCELRGKRFSSTDRIFAFHCARVGCVGGLWRGCG